MISVKTRKLILIAAVIFIFLLIIAAGVGIYFYVKSNPDVNPSQKCDAKYCRFPGGECTDNKCRCNKGWFGKYCTQKVNTCDPTKCKIPKGVCNDGICECTDKWGGENCQDKCADTETSMMCSDQLTYKCCDKSITSCDKDGNCCDNGIKTDNTCVDAYTCDVKDLGKCTTLDGTKCPPNWCPSQEHMLCEERFSKNKMFMIRNSAVSVVTVGLKKFMGKHISLQQEANWDVGVLGTRFWDNKLQLEHMPNYVDLACRKLFAPKENIDEYLYTDELRSTCMCPRDSPFLPCPPGKGGSIVCSHTIVEGGNEAPLSCLRPDNLWSIQKFKYKQFYKRKPESLLYQFASGFTKSYKCQMIKGTNIKNHILGMGPRKTPFPDTKKLGTFFRFFDYKEDHSNFFVNGVPDNNDYGTWETGIPWVEIEYPICGGPGPDGIKSVYQRDGVIDSGCKFNDSTICVPHSHTISGYYIYVRVQNPTTGIYYRFYLGVPYNTSIGGEDPSTLAKDEFGNNLGATCSADGTLKQGGNYPETLFFFTEDKSFGLEDYFKPNGIMSKGLPNGTYGTTNGSGGGPYGDITGKATGNKASRLDLFMWNFSEISPLAPQNKNSWQSDSLSDMPNCSQPACIPKNTYWTDDVGRCHIMSAELPPDLPWGKKGLDPFIGGTSITKDVNQIEGNGYGVKYHSSCKNGINITNTDPICDINQVETSSLNSMDTSCNVQAQNYCRGGAKYEAAVNCGAFIDPKGVTIDKLFKNTGGGCVPNKDPSIKTPHTQLFTDEHCTPAYACSAFGDNLPTFGGKNI